VLPEELLETSLVGWLTLDPDSVLVLDSLEAHQVQVRVQAPGQEVEALAQVQAAVPMEEHLLLAPSAHVNSAILEWEVIWVTSEGLEDSEVQAHKDPHHHHHHQDPSEGSEVHLAD